MDANTPSSSAPNSSSAPKPAVKASLFSRAPKSAPKPAAPPPPREPAKRPRRSGLSGLSALLSFVLVGVFVGLAGFVALLLAERRGGPLDQEKVVVLTREDDDGPIADQLEKAGVVENGMMFSIMALLDGQRSALKRGEYKFPAHASMRDVEEMLAHHRVVKHKLPVPEGLTSEQIVQRLRDSDLLTGDIKDLPREGSLYPDTYVFERGDSRNALLAHMATEQTRMVALIWAKRAPDLPIKSPGELVTLASVVEKETGKSDERPRVASVFVNRLQKHMKLQSDPTIVYGLVFGKGTLGHSITKAELQEATPYNTYFIDGLPPGPICNPGRAAMEAVANPAHTRDLFFVADGTGGHAFAETLDQHQKNVTRWRQIEKDAKEGKDRLSPDAAPPSNIRGEAPEMGASRYGVLSAPRDDKAFGALGFAAHSQAAPAISALAARLAKVADSRRKVDALVGAGGSLSANKFSAIDSLVVTGVNDPPPGSDESLAPPDDGPVASAPLSPAALADLRARAALADLRARAARFGGGAVEASLTTPQRPALVAPAPAGAQPRAFDASEGTALDPLLNKTYDLNYAKAVPAAFK